MIPWTEACPAPLYMEFSRLEYWSGLPFPSPGHLPNPGIEPRSPTLQADSLLAEPQGKVWKASKCNSAEIMIFPRLMTEVLNYR